MTVNAENKRNISKDIDNYEFLLLYGTSDVYNAANWCLLDIMTIYIQKQIEKKNIKSSKIKIYLNYYQNV